VPNKKRSPRLVKTVGAMVGGVFEAVTLQPLDCLKTRLQLAQGKSNTNVISVAIHMFKNEGPLAFYKGLTPFCTHLVTKYSVRWWFNEFYRGLLADKNGKVSTFGGLLAGLGSGITEAICIVTPFEVIKTRLQQQKGSNTENLKYKSALHCAQTMIKEEGPTALWKGNVPTMWRQGINQLFLFGSYDYLKKIVLGKEREESINAHESLILGIIAGSLGPFVNNPFDVAKTRMMAQVSIPGLIPVYKGTFPTIFKIYREEGPRTLMRGNMMRIARVAPGMGITFTCVEKFSEWFL